MASIYRPTYTARIPAGATLSTEDGVGVASWNNGRRRVKARVCISNPARCVRVSDRYWIRYTNADGNLVLAKGYRDLKATEQLAQDLVRQSERAAVGLDLRGRDPRESLPTLGELADAYRDHLKALGRTEHHVAGTHRILLEVLAGLHLDATEPGKADARRLVHWLATEARTRKRKWSPRTRNLYAGTVRAFGKWLTTDEGGRLPNPFPPIARLAEDPGRTIRRRALTHDELTALIDVTMTAPTLHGLTGTDRAGLYLLAAYTGYRIDELASLTAASIDWRNGLPVAVRVDARRSKRRQAECQPVPASIRAKLAAWLSDRTEQLFPHRFDWWKTEGADLLRKDLPRAGVAFETSAGRVDFHALRVTYTTLLARAGVPLQHAQKLARHSTPTLTAKVYTQLERERDLAAAADRIGEDYLCQTLCVNPRDTGRENPRTLDGRSQAKKLKSEKAKRK